MSTSRGTPRIEFEIVTGPYEASRDNPTVTVDASEGYIAVVFDERTRFRHFPIR